jgi:4-amino-4-deoxy-L-arabinose transferase-like glycosyltransferase
MFAALVLLFLMVASLYNVITPLYESPDELQHAAFVAWLAGGRGLPIVDAEEPGPWEQEGTQPPLYYWMVARLVGWLPLEGAEDLARLNPYAGIGDPQRPDNKNRVLHDLEREDWPYEGSVWAVHLARGISTLMAVGTLGAIYCMGRLAFPGRPAMALGMVALVAFIPQFLFLSASINNDNLVILVASWVLVLLANWLRAPGLPGRLSLVGLGVLLGLGALAKFSGALLWPLAAGVLLFLVWRERDSFDGPGRLLRWLILAGLLIFGLAIALSGWWFVRNYQLYHDLSGIGPHLEIMGTRRRLPSWENALREFRGFRISFWALFGWFNILAPEPFYWLMDGLTILGVVGLGVLLVRFLRRTPGQAPLPREARHILALLAGWLVLVLAGVLQWTVQTPASQGRLLYPALASVVLFLIVGWATLMPRRLRKPVGIVALAGWLVWAAACAFLIIRPAYALPGRAPSLQALDIGAPALQVRYGDCCELVGYVSPEEPVQPGDWVPLRLLWRVLEATDQDHTLFVHAVTVDGRVVGQLDTYHGGGMYPTSQWRPGEVIDDVAYVPISWRAEGPALIHFNVGLREDASSQRLPALAPDGTDLEPVLVGEAALVPLQWPALPPDLGTGTVFEEQIRLASTELAQTKLRPGGVVTATLHWVALSAIQEDYTGFVHLVAPGGGDVAQDDHVPLGGGYPTRLWVEGAVVPDPYRIQVPEDISAGTYELWGGLYRSGTGVRLQAVAQQSGERWKDDLVYLGSVVVVGNGE